MRSTKAYIIKEHLQHNLGEIRNAAPNAKVMAMVKANAYGHDAKLVAPVLEEQGVDFFAVAFPEEGIELRLAGVTKPIFVLVPSPVEDDYLYLEYNLQAIIESEERLIELGEFANKHKKTIKCHLFVDTGMHREGAQTDSALRILNIAKKFSYIEIIGLCTHFATADSSDEEMMLDQLEKFNTLFDELSKQGFSFEFVHSANSAAIIKNQNTHFNLVRPGLALYGYDPSEEKLYNNLKPVLKLVTKAYDTKTLNEGETTGYSKKFIAKEKTDIALLPIGYGCGVFSSLAHNIQCISNGKKYNSIGSICMDQMMIDISDSNFDKNDEIVLIGHSKEEFIGANELADKAGVIIYNVLTSLAARIPRILA